VDVDRAARQLLLSDGQILPYDYLIVASGATHAYFGHPEWEPIAPGLKTVDDATEIRRRLLLAFEAAEQQNDEAELRTGHFRVQIIEHGIRKSRFLVPKLPPRQSLKRFVERNRPLDTVFSRFGRRKGVGFRFLNISSGFLGRNEPA